MTSLVGIYDAGATTEGLRRVADRMRADGALAERQSAGADVARCDVVRCDGRDVIARGCGVWLAFDGEIYNAIELEQHLRDRGGAVAGSGHAALCLALLAQQGDSFVHQLNGQFNIAIYRTLEARLSIATDRNGYRPLFVTRRGNRVLFATAIKAILAGLDVTPGIDGIGLLEAMRSGMPVGNRTWLDGIIVADPGTWLHIDRDGWRQERYFRLRFAADESRDVEAHIEGLTVALSGAVSRAVSDGRRFGMPLSGGLDSRAILLATNAERPPALSYTFGREHSFDVMYARQLAQIAGVRYRHFPYARGYLGRVLEDVVRLNEGMTGFAHAAFTSFHFHDRIGPEADVLLYGHGGDCLTGAHLQPRIIAERSVERLIEGTFRQYNLTPEAVLRRVFDASFYRRHAGGLFDAMRASFAGIEGDNVADIANVWDMENRQRRGTFPSGAVDRYRFAVRAPFLDNDIVDHLRRVPLRWRFLQTGYKRMLVRGFRESAGVPWSYTGARLRPTLLGNLTQLSWNYVAKRLLPTAVDPRLFRDLTHDTRSDLVLAQALTDFARHPQFPGDIFNRAGIEDVIDRHWSGQNDFTHLVIMLATFATGWRLFLYESAPPRAAVAVAG